MVTRWTKKIVAFLHDPPGKPFILRSEKHEPHERLALALQTRALEGTPPSEGTEKAQKADHIASAADRVNFPAAATAYWDRVEPILTHPLAKSAKYCRVPLTRKMVPELDRKVQEKARPLISNWADKVKSQSHSDKEKRLYLYLWRLLYEELARQTSLEGWVRLLPADTRQPDHSLQQHLSISAAIADALPRPAFLIFSIGPVQDFIAAARRTQDLWMGSWILSYLSWKAMERLADEFGPDVIVFPSLRGQPLCDWWLNKTYGLPCQLGSADLGRPTFPNRFLALLPAEEACRAAEATPPCPGGAGRLPPGENCKAAEKAKKAVQEEWKRLAQQVYNALTSTSILPADGQTAGMWGNQIQGLLEIYWVVLPWPGDDQPPGTAQAEAGKELYEQLCQPPQGKDWEFRRIYETLTRKGQYNPNWGTVWSLLYDLADRAFNARKNLRDFKQAEETGDKCTQCGQRAALRSGSLDSRDFWKQVAENLRRQKRYDIKPDGRERLCAVCTVKRFVQREVLEREFELRGGFPSTSEIAAASFKKRVLEDLRNGNQEVQKALQDFLNEASRLIPTTVAPGAVPYLEKQKQGPLAEQLLQIDGEWLHIESWTKERLEEAGATLNDKDIDIQKVQKALRGLYEKVGIKPSKYYALLYMDGDQMGRWLSGTHEGLATFGDILHPEVREALQNDPEWQPLLGMKRLITPAVHAAISQALGWFALRLVPHIVEERHAGRLIYAGGDDVLALVPMDEVLAVARELRAAFSGHIRFESGSLQVVLAAEAKQDDGDPPCMPEGSVSGYVEWEDEVFLTMGPRATASMGVVLAHHLQPLDLVLDAVREAERLAKHRYGRNALVLNLLKRSGERLTVGTKWSYKEVPDVVCLLTMIIQHFERKTLSGKWPYATKAEASILEGLPVAAQEAELRRLLKRHTESDLSPAEAKEVEQLSRPLIKWAESLGPSGFTEMARWLLVCNFIAKGGDV